MTNFYQTYFFSQFLILKPINFKNIDRIRFKQIEYQSQ